MDIDNDNKKRKIEPTEPVIEPVKEPETVTLNLSDVLTKYMESHKEIVQVLAILFQKIERLETVLGSPLLK